MDWNWDSFDWSPLIISAKVSVIATLMTFVIGILMAYMVSRIRIGKGVLDGVFTLPLVLPPTVIGFFILQILSVNNPVGSFLYENGINLLMTWEGATLAATVVSFPLMYRTVRGSIENFDENIINAARTLGMSDTSILFKVILPNIVPGLVAGAVLSFARALGEFGATIMIAGNIPGRTQTLSIAVYSAYLNYHIDLAYQWVFVICVISFSMMILMNWFNSRNGNTSGGR